MTLGEIAIGLVVSVTHVGGERAFRRRMMELGLLPGSRVEIVRVAPLGDPIQLRVRGCLLSIRRAEAQSIAVAVEEPAHRRPGTVEQELSLPPALPAAP